MTAAAERYLDIDGYADLLDVPRSWVRDAVTARRLQITWVGRHARFSPDDIEANRRAWVKAPASTSARVGTGPPPPAPPAPPGPTGPPRRRLRPVA